MVRRILVPLDPSPYTKCTLAYALDIAEEQEAEVTALAVLDVPAIEAAVGPGTPGSMKFVEAAERRRISEAHHHIQDMLQEFARKCEKAGVTHKELEIQGDPVEVITREAMFYDLLIVGLKTYYHHETTDKPGKSLKQLLGRLATPVLVVAEKTKALDAPRVVIPFDGGFSVMRSLRQFVATAAFDNPTITLVTSSDNQEEAHALQQRAAEYLATYGYTQVKHEWTAEDILRAMKEEYVKQADLVVLGMHTKTSWFDFSSIGSVTNYLLDEGNTPLFMGQ